MKDTKTSSTMKTAKKKVDRHGNDLEQVKKVDELAIKTQNLVCAIHGKKFSKHNDDELLEDYNLSGLRYQKSQGHLYHTDEIEPMEVSTLEDMEKLGITNKDLEAGVASSCRRDFNSLLEYNGHIAHTTLRLLDEVSKLTLKDKLKWIALLIGTKNLRLLGNCLNLTCDGHYESALVLIRPAMENYLLLEYLLEHKNKVDDFYNMKLKLSSTKLINNARKKHTGFGSLWGILCEQYAHSTFLSLNTITQVAEDPEQSIVNILPYYDKEQAESNLKYAAFFQLLILTPLTEVFKDDLEDVGGLSQTVLTFAEVLIELQKNPKLQIEFS